MTKFFQIAAVLAGGLLFSQNTGIGTTAPKATLDVVGAPDTAAVSDGIIPPRISRTQLANKTAYSTAQAGAVVYVTDVSGNSNAATARVDKPGLYFWDGYAWQKPGPDAGWSTIGNAGTTAGANFIGTTDNQDVVFKRNNLSAGRLNSASTAFGAGALSNYDFLNTSVLNYNTAFGNDALRALTTGGSNTAIGFASLRNITTSSSNTAVGLMSLLSLVSGNQNVAIGQGVGNNSSQGSYNILIGAGVNKPFNSIGNNQLNIGNWIFGNDGKIGIGPSYRGSYGGIDVLTAGKLPTEQLEVDGSVKLLKLPTAAYVGSATDKSVVVDANGVLKTAAALPPPLSGTLADGESINTQVSSDNYMPILLKFQPAGGFMGYQFTRENNVWVLTVQAGDGFSTGNPHADYVIEWARRN